MKDFESRARAEAHGPFRVASLGEYITINPMADEADLLARLGISREQCVKVDCYWMRDDDVYFVQVETRTYAGRATGLWARRPSDPGRHTNLVAVVDEEYVTREIVDRALRALDQSSFREVQLDESLALVSNTALALEFSAGGHPRSLLVMKSRNTKMS